jgi:hypothetical protein
LTFKVPKYVIYEPNLVVQLDKIMPSLLDLLDSVSQEIDDEALKEMLVEEWMKEYQKLEVMEERSDKKWKRLAELHDKLSDYRLSDPLKFDKKFLSHNDKGDAQEEQGTSPDNTNTYGDLEELSPKSGNISLKECNNANIANLKNAIGESHRLHTDGTQGCNRACWCSSCMVQQQLEEESGGSTKSAHQITRLARQKNGVFPSLRIFQRSRAARKQYLTYQ